MMSTWREMVSTKLFLLVRRSSSASRMNDDESHNTNLDWNEYDSNNVSIYLALLCQDTKTN